MHLADDRPSVNDPQRSGIEHMERKGLKGLPAARGTLVFWGIGLALGGFLGYAGYKAMHTEEMVEIFPHLRSDADRFY